MTDFFQKNKALTNMVKTKRTKKLFNTFPKFNIQNCQFTSNVNQEQPSSQNNW